MALLSAMARTEIRITGRVLLPLLRSLMSLFAMKISNLRNNMTLMFGKSRNYIGMNPFKSSLLLLFLLAFTSQQCFSQYKSEEVIPGAERTDIYLPLLKSKRVALVVNHASLVKSRHLADTLMSLDISLVKIFSPEHGFRGKADAGEHLGNDVDPKTGIPIISLYGENKEPRKDQLAGIDVVVFDLQDVGVRFYTYISTLSLVMKACAENNVEVIVLDRPNPNGHYIDGPILETRFKSFVGMHEVPVVYGMTIGEYALMVIGEKWSGTENCLLRVIPIDKYDHNTVYNLPVRPSPNLPNMKSVYLYPSLCFFEGTVVSIGRGTDLPFQVVGHPDYAAGNFTFIPKSTEGSKEPKLLGRSCSGINLSIRDEMDIRSESRLNLSYLIDFYRAIPDKKTFFTNYFNLLAGNTILRQQIIEGKSEKEIRSTWAFDLDKFKKIREKYLLYPDFEVRIQIED